MSQDESACPSQVPARALPPFAQSGRPPSARPVCAPLLFSSVWQQLSRGAENSSPMTSGSTACTDCSSSPCQSIPEIVGQYGLLRPSALHRYSHTQDFSLLCFSLGIKATGSRSAL